MTGSEATKAMANIFRRRKKYDPDNYRGSAAATMRQLLSGRFGGDSSPNRQVNLSVFSRAKCLKDQSPNPVSTALLARIDRPKQPVKLVDWNNFYPLVSAFWAWCKKERISHLIDIDHQLGSDPQNWPLMKRFQKELEQRGKMRIEDIFNEEWQSCDDADFTSAYMPLFDGNSYGDDVVLYEFLENFSSQSFESIEFPSAAVEFCEGDIQAAEAVLKNIAAAGRFGLLTGKIGRALTGLVESRSPVFFHDYEQCRVEILEADAVSIDYLFESCAAANKMRDAVWLILRDYMNDPMRFWQRLIDKLLLIGRKYPAFAAHSERINISV